MSVQVKSFFHQPTSTLTYVVFDLQQGDAAVIDPALDYDAASGRTSLDFIDEIIGFIHKQKLNLKWILETHAHADHLTASQYLQQQLGGKIAIGEGIQGIQAHFARVFNFTGDNLPKAEDFDKLFTAHETFMLGEYEVEVIPTPGHTNDSVSYLVDGKAFVGDSLFMPDAGTARCDFPGGDANVLFDSVQRLYALGDQVEIYTGHDYQPGGRALQYMATVAQHKASNIHIDATTDKTTFVASRQARDATLGLPKLIVQSIQVNIRAGQFPVAEDNGVSYLKTPLNLLG